MNTLLYIAEANLYLALFAGFYFLALRRVKNHLANRWVLITSVLLAWIIPSISYVGPVADFMPTIELEAITLTVKGKPTEGGFDYSSLLFWIYASGVVIASAVFITRLLRVFILAANSTQTVSSDLKLIETDNEEAWSFFSLVALGRKITTNHKQWILEHEKVHVEEWHSIDKVLMQLAKILGWFNPATYYMEYALEENHEFRADEVVCSKFSDSITYSQILVSQSMGGFHTKLFAHKFSKKALLKTRIQMIHQTKQSGKMKYLLAIPVLALALFMHSCEEKDSSEVVVPSESKTIKPYDQNTPEGVYEVVEKMPEFKGGMNALATFMIENTAYPEDAKASKEEGKVFVKFIIDESGKVTKPEVLQDISVESAALHTAAIATISKMPAWTPGEQDGQKVKVQYVMPIQFTLENDK